MNGTATPDPDLSEALSRALAYTDAVGLSDGTDRPATDVDSLGETAHLVEHTYHDGYGRREFDRPFHTVHCDRCGIVLNSGHHYRPEADGTPSRFALELAAEHNRDAHDLAEVPT